MFIVLAGSPIRGGDLMTKFACPCCGYKTLDAQRDDEICEICYWHDEIVQYEDPDLRVGQMHRHCVRHRRISSHSEQKSGEF